MNITYINHSGFFVEFEESWMLFDYYSGHIPKLPKGKKGYVFSSHRHPDHFNPKIFKLCEEQDNIQFILSSDIGEKKVPEDLREQVFYMKPNKDLMVDAVEIHTLRSTDEGVAFIVKSEGRVLYHAGDLNDWYWKEESEEWNRKMGQSFRKCIEPLRGMKIDAAFVPLDPRQEEYYNCGMDYFLELTESKKVYPMHFWGEPEIIDQWLSEHADSPHAGKIVKIAGAGNLFQQ